MQNYHISYKMLFLTKNKVFKCDAAAIQSIFKVMAQCLDFMVYKIYKN